MAGFKGEGVEIIVKLTFINGFPDQISVALQQIPNVEDIPMSDLINTARVLATRKTHDVASVATKRPGV